MQTTENGAGDFIFSFTKNACLIFRQLQKREGKICTRFNRRREK